MNVLLTNGDFGTYELTPVNKIIAKKLKQETGEESILIQTDYDFPILARNLGWNGKVGREKCKHVRTDGTVDCPTCGLKSIDFISAAIDWLDNHNGHVFRSKADCYFGGY